MARTTSRRRAGLIVLGGVALGAGMLYRQRLMRLLKGRTSAQPGTSGPSDRPVATTSTAFPLPGAHTEPVGVPAEEEAVAAAETGDIGGPGPDDAVAGTDEPAGVPGEEEAVAAAETGTAEDAQRVVEAQQPTEAEPAEADMTPEEHEVQDLVEATDNPVAGEEAEALAPPRDAGPDVGAGTAGADRRDDPGPPITPGVPPTEPPAGPRQAVTGNRGGWTRAAPVTPQATPTPSAVPWRQRRSEWQTWSGRALRP